MAITPYIKRLIEEQASLTRPEAHDLMHLVLREQASEIEIAAMLGALAARGETAAEIAGFVDAMRAAATPIPLHEALRAELVDTCGTGGDGAGHLQHLDRRGTRRGGGRS